MLDDDTPCLFARIVLSDRLQAVLVLQRVLPAAINLVELEQFALVLLVALLATDLTLLLAPPRAARRHLGAW